MLGGLTVVQGDRRISRFQTQKTGALLAYLALTPGKNHARESLAEMLWPDGDPIAIRNRLNQAISSLRRQLHPPELGPGSVLVADHYSIGINAQTVSTDVQDFERDMKLADKEESDEARVRILRQAVDRYRGELLDGYFEEWIFSRRMHLADLYDKALQQLIRSHVALGSPEAAIEFARRRLDLDPYDEAPHVILMRLYLRSGRPKSAIKQFDDLVRALRQFDEAPGDNARKYLAKAEALASARSADSEGDESFDAGPQSRPLPAPAAPALPEAMPTLPRVVTSFVDREEEMRRIVESLTGPGRLVTLLGLGGCGKSRLAIEAGWKLADTFQGQIHFVQLANVSSAEDIPAEIARAIIPGETRVADPYRVLVSHLELQNLCLIILDNFEQLAESGSRLVTELLQKLPGLRLLVTSRVPLNAEGEIQILLSPLPLPDPGSHHNLSHLASNPAVSLFVDRAQMVKSDFQLTERTAESILKLSRKLEGLPLALELAASWARVLTPSQMVAEVESNVDQLASRRRDVNPRHRSLRAAFDGTYALLDEDLKSLFARLTIFSGGWDIGAAEAVCQESDIVTKLQVLEERALVHSEPTEHSLRFSMLATVREFGRSLIDPELEAVSARFHAQYFLARASEAMPYSRWAELVQYDHGNLVQALKWLQQQGSSDDYAQMVVAMCRYWEGHGMLAEGREWVSLALLDSDRMTPLLRARLQIAGAGIEWLLGNFAVAASCAQEALEELSHLGAGSDQIRAQFLLQLEAHRQGDYEEAKRILESNLALSQQLGDLGSEARSWLALGNVAVEEGQLDLAMTRFEKSLEVARAANHRDHVVSALTNLANLAVYESKLEAAEKWISEAVAQIDSRDRRWRMAMSFIVRARVENAMGRHREALATLDRSYRMAPDETVVIWRILLQTGIALMGLKAFDEAARTFGYLEKYRNQIGEAHRGIEMREYDQKLAELGATFEPNRLEEQFDIGRNMDLKEVLSQFPIHF
jgi:predicted ATPase/DNA-binding SARP family transcriptional activator